MECEFCGNVFMNIYILKNHQIKTKYCLIKQNKIDKQNIGKDLYECVACLIKIDPKTKKRHDNNCKKLLHKNIKELNEIIIQKDIEIKNLIIQKETEMKENIKIQTSHDIYKDFFTKHAKPENTNIITETNNIINMSPLDINKDKFGETIDELFNKNYLLNGQKGVARFAVDNLLKDNFGNLTYRCTDPSRQIYRYRSLEGEMVKDVKAKKLTSSLLDKLTTKSSEITKDETKDSCEDKFFMYSNNFLEIKRLEDDNKDFITELASLTG